MHDWACPFGVACRAINYYGFLALKPFDLGTETVADRGTRYQKRLGEVLPRMGALWEQEWLPAILPGLERGRTADYTALSNAELWHTLDDMLRDFLARWTVHGYVNFVTISASWFADFYNETFAPADPTEPYLSLQGFPTRSLDAGRGLWRLSRSIKTSPVLKRVFEEQEPAQLVAHLERCYDCQWQELVTTFFRSSSCFWSSVHRKRRSQENTTGAPAALRGWAPPFLASGGCRPLSRLACPLLAA
jgi:hypothetical protein